MPSLASPKTSPRSQSRAAALFLLLFTVPSLLLAGAAAADDPPELIGSIQGRVYDKETGESVAFADVILVGTGNGAISGQDGTFRFVQVPEGIYQLRVNRMGYGTELVDQVRVEAGYVKKLSVGLDPIEVREVEAIRVGGDREFVDVEVAKTSHMVTAEQIEGMAVTVVDDVVSKQTGVVAEDDNLYVRGGRAEDTVYRIDGVVIRDLITGRSSAGNISARSVKSVEIIRPPETAIPRGWMMLEPSPIPMAMGSMPKTVVNMVIKMGVNRIPADSTRASILSVYSARFLL